LSEHFINERGKAPDFWAREAKKRSWSVWNSDPWDNDYRQSAKPVREQTEATGHAVRAVYLYTGMADLASETDDKELFSACRYAHSCPAAARYDIFYPHIIRIVCDTFKLNAV